MKKSGSAQDPLWYKDAIIYEAHVKAFFDSNHDGIGDFKGLTEKLDYLEELGITCLWLLPFFPSPGRDDGYDIADYTSVNPSYGTLDDFTALIVAAHARNLQVLIELVISHTSDQHPWFQAARKAPAGSPARQFYVWSDTDEKYRDARIIFSDSEKSNWTWDGEAKAYYWHRFFSHQPDLNFDNPAVVEEVVNVMRFWLDLGVDGLRLDAIPYLVEREGTNCENLPETHAIVKTLRRRMDEAYANRMFLAEANQWPPDVRPYFGDGDECHAVFHFPLMPRMFMAMRLEDRHPITEIMAQTPAIPESCQWALFLRNHDELTLEMVTDQERDYMYLAYGTDPRMRLNVGIRRRLAPLMGNNRRRIELLNSLLLSFPGTPVIYYGDEIGMGDNIYLGDRNGVRTPMQWSPDRNAGFSRANPAKLYSPVIMDAVYGYEAVNVEAQQSEASSLLHWMRNMIALRKVFKVFGRGSIEFLHPANRKVLAYVRRYEDDRILCLANLSRFGQPVELDLSTFAGMTPVEMLGYTEFPQIGRTPYPLTLAPYGFFWFELQGAAEPVEVTTRGQVGQSGILHVDGGWRGLVQGRTRETLEASVLPRFLPRQRWFGGKARTIQTARIRDNASLMDEPVAAGLAIVDVEYAGGGSETYLLTLALARAPLADAVERDHPASVLCRVTGQEGNGVLFEAVANDDACHRLLRLIAGAGEVPTEQGLVRAQQTAVCRDIIGSDEAALEIGRGSAEQSHTSVRFADRATLKLFRRLEPGPNPDYEIGRHLTERARFDRVPRLAGVLEYLHDEGPPVTLAILQELVRNQGDGWTQMLEDLGRYYEQCLVTTRSADGLARHGASLLDLTEGETPEIVRELLGLTLDSASMLGRRTAEMHAALASPVDDPAFAPEPFTADDQRRLAEDLRSHAAAVFEGLRAGLAALPDEAVDLAGLMLSRRRQVLARLSALTGPLPGGTKIRIHGDYHLGQVLWVEHDYVILDFEGEPARPLTERRAKQLALKDVAGMLRSFSYAAFSELRALAARRPDGSDRLEAWAEVWERWVSASFLKAYRAAAAGAAFLPPDRAQVEALLDAFLLDKALYEVSYEMNNRPGWVRVPLQGLLGLLSRSSLRGDG